MKNNHVILLRIFFVVVVVVVFLMSVLWNYMVWAVFLWWCLAAACDPPQRVRLTWHDFPGAMAALAVQQAFPSVFLFVHKLWADRWPSFRLRTKDKKKKQDSHQTAAFWKHVGSFGRTSAVMSQHVYEILKKESAWMTNGIVSLDTRGSRVLFLSTALSGSSVFISLHHCMVYIM